MRPPEPTLLSPHDYPVDPWRLVERRFSSSLLPRSETLFACANGFVGLRGNPEEGRPAHDHGTFVNGFHETWAIHHAEEAYGLARTGQTMVDVPDPKIIKLYVDDEPLYLPDALLPEYERVLDFRRGVLERSLIWETPSGKRVQVRSQRLASLRHRHLVGMSYEVTVLDSDAPVVISSQLHNRQDAEPHDTRQEQFDPRTTRTFADRVLHTQVSREDGERILLGYRTGRSGMTLGCGIDHAVETDNTYQVHREVGEDLAKVIYTVQAKQGQPFRLEKFVSYHSSSTVPSHELVDRTDRVLTRAVSVGLDQLAADQAEDCAAFWDRADVEVDGDARTQQAVRWNLFQLLQATERAEGTSIPAKGLTGHGYEGHYFWDLDIYVMPFLAYSTPRVAKNVLRWRRSMLDMARRRAEELGHVGALYPWRTINGEEASAYYMAGTAQYHLNADIAYTLRRYVDVTGDHDILSESGAEILAETARLWLDLGFHGDDGQFHLHAVTGPDEYTAMVDDNTFTNLMAKRNLEYAAEVIEDLAERDPHRWAVLRDDLDLQPEEPQRWREAAQAMHVPYDEVRGIHPQDAHFLERKRWDLEHTPADRFPLLLHYHPLVIYRHQVLKQADVILALCLLSDEFDEDVKRRDFAYYEPLTTGDSSLSPPAQAMVAAEIGEQDTALAHFQQALFMDLADVAGNVDHGVHVACAGGVWMSLVYGFAGMRDNGLLRFDPRLPEGWDALRFRLRKQDRPLQVEVTHEALSVALFDEGAPLEVEVRGKVVTAEPGAPATVPLG